MREILHNPTPPAIAAIARDESRAARERHARALLADYRARVEAATESRVLRTYDAASQADLPLRAIDQYASWLRAQHPTLTVDVRGGWRDGRVVLELWVTAPWLDAVLGDVDALTEADADALAAERAQEMGVWGDAA